MSAYVEALIQDWRALVHETVHVAEEEWKRVEGLGYSGRAGRVKHLQSAQRDAQHE